MVPTPELNCSVMVGTAGDTGINHAERYALLEDHLLEVLKRLDDVHAQVSAARELLDVRRGDAA